MMEGNLWLLDTVGVIPKNAWAIDPFGHSATMAYLLQRMGFKNMLIQRAHYEVKKALALEQNLEFIWRQSWDSENSSDIFCHMMPFYSYDVPHTCGPEPAVCCQFDFWRMPRYGGALRCPWHLDPVETAPDNVQERATKLLDQYRKKSTLYKSNTLLVPLGDDFRYTSLEEAELQFRNYQALFDYINSHPELKAQVHFGTLEDYFSSLRDEVESGGDNRHDAPKFPSLSGDFFTYADRVQDYWSGYYVSRPFYKAIDRVLEESLRAAEILFFLAQAYCQANDYHSFPLSFGKELVNARRNLALFQHHDGVTGTAKDHVVVDYGTRMHNSLSELQSFMAASVGALLNKDSPGVCDADQLSFFQPEQSRTSHDILALKKFVDVASGNTIQVVLFNPLEETVEQVITILVNSSAACLVDSNWASVSSQVSPDWTQGTSYLVTGRHRLQWQASIPPLGFQTYFILSSKDNAYCNQAVLSKLKIYNADKDFICPPPYKCSLETVETIRINNEHLTLSFASRSGMLQDLKSHKDGSHTNLVEDLCLYSSRGGAYLFLPQGQATSIVDADGLILVTEGPMMQEVSTIPNTAFDHTPVIRSARLFAGNSVQSLILEMEYHVELLDSTFNNKEIITRFKTDINSGKVFYSDLNGFQTIRRETYDKIPLQGNYYPMPSLAFLQDPEGRRFSVHSRQAVGVASLNNGFLEMMLDRRLTRDDDRGLGQGVLDNHPTNVVFHLLVESNISSLLTGSSSAPRLPSLLSHRVGSQLNYPLHAFLRKPKHLPDAQAEAKSLMPKWKVGLVPWASTFPCDLHLVSLKILRPLQFLNAATSKELQFGLLLQRRGWDPSYCKKGGTDCRTLANGSFDLSDVLTGLTTSQIRKSSLTFLHEDLQVRGYIEQLHRKQITGVSKRKIPIDLKPMEIQAFKFALKHVR
ncbi:hypothetical protein O6H91_14G034400 [Diphasiastrum complanatum]|nr:hypothetical protein O6H91_14G034400 [Diphasiastrum complanatum]